MELNFGKYNGQNITDVYNNDKNYCVWLYKQTQLLEDKDEIRDFLRSKLINPDSYYMTWGKYKGRSLHEIEAIDAKYLDWLRENTFVMTKCKQLYKALVVM